MGLKGQRWRDEFGTLLSGTNNHKFSFDRLTVSLLVVKHEWTSLRVSEREDRVEIEEEAEKKEVSKAKSLSPSGAVYKANK